MPFCRAKKDITEFAFFIRAYQCLPPTIGLYDGLGRLFHIMCGIAPTRFDFMGNLIPAIVLDFIYLMY